MKIPRILLAAGASGSGKTLITCGILQALKKRKMNIASFKCGPDYIDPMFHSRVIGTKSRNLDTFFFGAEMTRHLLCKNAADCDIAVMEGVMGYYDGVAGTTTQASAYDLAVTTDTPVILIVNSKGMSVSLAAYIKGFLEYRENSMIKGVILNQMSPMLYPRMKQLIEEETGISVVGYVPKLEDCVIESRHLGLVLPEEITDLQTTLEQLAQKLEQTLDMDTILKIAEEAVELQNPYPDKSKMPEEFQWKPSIPLRLGLASDAAFCFFYEDNFVLMREMGIELVTFSPLHDHSLPENLDGLLLYGGYPELHGRELEENQTMRFSIRAAIEQGMPCLAECGGFMYLHRKMQGADDIYYDALGVLDGKIDRTTSLKRFGYITLEAKDGNLSQKLGAVPAHEFHYYESDMCGEAYHASKPYSKRGWDCIHHTEQLLAGFPHVHYYANPKWIINYLEKCERYHLRSHQKSEMI